MSSDLISAYVSLAPELAPVLARIRFAFDGTGQIYYGQHVKRIRRLKSVLGADGDRLFPEGDLSRNDADEVGRLLGRQASQGLAAVTLMDVADPSPAAAYVFVFAGVFEIGLDEDRAILALAYTLIHEIIHGVVELEGIHWCGSRVSINTCLGLMGVRQRDLYNVLVAISECLALAVHWGDVSPPHRRAWERKLVVWGSRYPAVQQLVPVVVRELGASMGAAGNAALREPAPRRRPSRK